MRLKLGSELLEKITLLHTNDLHSHFENWPKIRRYLQKTKANLMKNNGTVITVDLGDAMDRQHPLSEATDGKCNTQLLNQINYDAVTIGNNEGIGNTHEQLNELYEAANFDVLLDDIEDMTTHQLPKWAQRTKIITTKAGTKVGLFALTAPFLTTYEMHQWHPLDVTKTIQAILPQLRQQCDVVVLMSHLGLPVDKELAQKFPEIDVILGSHTHHLLPEGLQVNHSLLAAAGKWGRYVGRVDLTLDDSHKLTHAQARVVATEDLPSAQGDQEEINNLFKQGQQLLAAHQVAQLPQGLAANYFKPSPLMTTCLKALCSLTKAPVAILNGGLLLGDLPAGVVTKADLHRILPHAMRIVKVTLGGSDLWRLVREMEKNRRFLLNSHPKGNGFRGTTFGALCYYNLWYDATTDTVWYDGQQVDWAKKYTVALVDNYVYIQYFPTLEIAGKLHYYGGGFLRDALAKYLQAQYPKED